MEQKIFEINEESLEIIKEWYKDTKALLEFGESVDVDLLETLKDITDRGHITEDSMERFCLVLYKMIHNESEDMIAERSKEEAIRITTDLNLTDIFSNN